jgi:DNA-binding MarR family transcriptional regulator
MLDDSIPYLLHKLTSELNRGADRILRAGFGVSYNRALFMIELQQQGTLTQHELATALGYSDPAVSTMLLELAKEGYIETAPSPEHGRKRLVTLTAKGSAAVEEGRRLLDSRFRELMSAAGVDAQHYRELTEQIYRTLVGKPGKAREPGEFGEPGQE